MVLAPPPRSPSLAPDLPTWQESWAKETKPVVALVEVADMKGWDLLRRGRWRAAQTPVLAESSGTAGSVGRPSQLRLVRRKPMSLGELEKLANERNEQLDAIGEPRLTVPEEPSTL
jgi:hypothetical protein